MGYDMHWKIPPDEAMRAIYERASEAFNVAVVARDALPRDERGTWQRGDDPDGAPANASDRYKAAQVRVTEAYDAMMKAQPGYFRLNIWGMLIYRDLLERLEVGYWPDSSPEWPDCPFEGQMRVDFWEHDDWDSEQRIEYEAQYPGRLAAFRAHQDQLDAHRAWVPEDATYKAEEGGETRLVWRGINLEKFSSNDGWLVLPEECNAALRIIAAVPPDHLDAELRAAYPDSDKPGVMENIRNLWQEWVHFLIGAEHHGGFEVF